ncbi:MAG: hypothetical protein MUF71_05840 [Candidatus Kapabacteria bacterium]|jgi:Tfp pilus assembly PilM family ATPase|nr:hypothetical protein [Candidatus Kapabacteria bacterium]
MLIGSTIATLYFDSYRTYCMLFEPQNGVLALTYINATSQALDCTRPLAEVLDSAAMHEIETILHPIQGKARSLGVGMTMESVLAHQIPYSNTLTTDELRRIVRLEASEHLPTFDPSQFLATIYPLYGFASNPFTAMSVLVSRTITGVAEHTAKLAGADLQRFVSAQTAAHTAFMHSYPEERGVMALCGIQHGYMDISIIRNAVLLHTATISLLSQTEDSDEYSSETSSNLSFGDRCANALREAAEAVQAEIDAAYFFGADLTKSALDEAALTLAFPVKRLNPLRQLQTTLESRLQAYASRVAHTLVPAVGAALPEVQPGIILSSNLPQQRKVA